MRSDVIDADAAVDEIGRHKVTLDAVVERAPDVVPVVATFCNDADTLNVGTRFFSIVFQRILKNDFSQRNGRNLSSN